MHDLEPPQYSFILGTQSGAGSLQEAFPNPSDVGRRRISWLYYIMHVNNIPSMLKLGILCHKRVIDEGVEYTPIYDESIVSRRQLKRVPDGRSLWDFANFYFQPRNAMLFRVMLEKPESAIAVVAVKPDILNRRDILITTGNAASAQSDILPRDEGLKGLYRMMNVFDREYWADVDGSKREMMAECLVPDMIPPEYLQTIYVANHQVAEQLRSTIPPGTMPIIPEPRMFFRPFRQIPLTPQLALLDGDMFFSRLHTLTISVNTVGVMGKGLASRAKYQFPDVYVLFQDLCRKRTLQMGAPFLYKRESSLDYELADEPSSLSAANAQTWFLLFPTKRHWREPGDVRGIEQGLLWLQQSYKTEGIQSLAVPALGCGLGRLDWRDVGPLLCRHLSALDVPVELYLPAEKKIPSEFLTKDFLLRSGHS